MPKYILDQIKIEGQMKSIIANTTGENVALNIDGRQTTLALELARLITEISALPTTEAVNTAVTGAIDALIAGAPGTYDTFKEIADYIATHEDVATSLNAAIGNKVDKEEGKGLSAEDFTTALKTKLESLKLVESSATNGNIKIDGEEVTVYAHPTGAGNAHIPAGGTEGQVLTRTAEGYAFADAPAGVRYGETVPEDLREGEMFIRIVNA